MTSPMAVHRDRDIDLALITGAGASREFGVNHTQLPLMGDWAESLVRKLEVHPGYAKLAGLRRGLLGSEFEEQLGRFLGEGDSFKRVARLIVDCTELPTVSSSYSPSGQPLLQEWHQHLTHHLEEVMNLVHESLYELFATPSVDAGKATIAYQALFQALGLRGNTPWFYATTNYDTIAECAIKDAGAFPDWGQPPTDPGSAEAPIVVRNLIHGIGRFVPVLHLHGRVGWYRREDGRVFSGAIQRHQKGFGTPIVMLPDPNKVYDGDDVINVLWEQFVEGLQRAKRVVVLGHSLNDALLVRALRENVTPIQRLAVTVLASKGSETQIDDSASSVVDVIDKELQGATVIPMRFGNPSSPAHDRFADWTERLGTGGLL